MKRRSFLVQASSITGLLASRKLAFAKDALRSPDVPTAASPHLWFDAPAGDWNEALPIGNGRMGAMIFSGIQEDHLQLNEDTLCSEEPGTSDLPLKVGPQYPAVIDLLRSGNYAEAGDLITKNWTGRSWPCYQPMADLFLTFADHDQTPASYHRQLNLADATTTATYVRDGVTYTREYFASHPDQVIVVRLSASKPGALTFRGRLTSVHPTASTTADGSGSLILKGQVPGFVLRRTLEWVEQRGEQWKYPEVWNKDGTRKPNANTVLYAKDVDGRGTFFETRLKLIASGGQVSNDGTEMHVVGATEVLLLVSAATSYDGSGKSPSRDGIDPSKRAHADLTQASAHSYTTLRTRHVSDHRALFDRVSVQIGTDTEQSKLPTDRRIAQFARGDDPTFPALYLQFARYLTIAGSRPGSQPLNLQGMWNDQVIPPWACGYTTNINLEMNYWPVDTLNLGECFEPLERLIHEAAATGRKVAQAMYERRGWVLHHNTTLWRGAQPVDNNALPAFWNVGAGWLSQHLWEHYLFTRDEAFLARSYPVMIGAAEFLADWLVEDSHGHLVTAAGVSPENSFYYTGSQGTRQKGGVCMGPTMDIAITRQLFRNCIEAGKILNRNEPIQQELQQKLVRLLPYQVGSRGQLQEWPVDFEEVDPHHRHVSHLYGVYPDHQITADTPELLAAARRTLELRGDQGTGWSRAWKICLWARLQDGDHAYKLVSNLFKPSHDLAPDAEQGGLMPNMFCSCPPMQIDGNFGGAAGIAEMLLQSHTGEIHLLPALPDQWPDGRFKGLRSRSGIEVAAQWKRGKLVSAELKSASDAPCRIRYGARAWTAQVKAGVPYRLSI